MIDFPASPTNGQQFSAAGVTWTWDGVKWTPVIGSIIGIPDAPVDGTTYGRKDASWAPAGGGVTDGSNAAAGMVGEVISSATGSTAALTSGSTLVLTSITLTPGDWDVQGEVWFSGGGGAGTVLTSAIGAIFTSVSLPAAQLLGAGRSGGPMASMGMGSGAALVVPVRPFRASVTANQTQNLMAQMIFASGSPGASGNIWARRAR